MAASPTVDDRVLRQRVVGLAVVLLLLAILFAATFQVLLPFVGVITYAVILATATSGLFERLTRLLGGKRSLAAVLYALVIVAITAVPLFYLATAIGELLQVGEQWLRTASVEGVPNLPVWIAELPLVGSKIATGWEALQRDSTEVLQQHQPQLIELGGWLLELSTGLLGAVLEILLGAIVAAIMLSSAARILRFTDRLAVRLAGPEGTRVLQAAARAIRGVAIGVIGTALLEFVLAWIGFSIAGVPGGTALAAITFLLAVVQIGPLLVWLPVAIWLATQGQVGWAVFMALWGIVALMGTDNIVKPILIARSGKLPLLVLFVGVIGGLSAWGFTGMFIGAMTLAIMWTVLTDYLGAKADPPAAAAPDG